MRKMKYMLFFTLATFALAACTQDDITSPVMGVEEVTPLTLTATIAGGADTRATVDNDWEGGEQIALQVNSGTYYDYTVDQDGNMTGDYYWQDGETADIQGFCPSSLISNNMVWTVGSTQNDDTVYRNSDLLCSLKQTVSKNAGVRDLAFYHQTAKLVVNVKNEGYLSGGTNSAISMFIGENDNIKQQAVGTSNRVRPAPLLHIMQLPLLVVLPVSKPSSSRRRLTRALFSSSMWEMSVPSATQFQQEVSRGMQEWCTPTM